MRDEIGCERGGCFEEIDVPKALQKPRLFRRRPPVFSTKHPSGDDLEMAIHMYETGAEEDIARAKDAARRDGRMKYDTKE